MTLEQNLPDYTDLTVSMPGVDVSILQIFIISKSQFLKKYKPKEKFSKFFSLLYTFHIENKEVSDTFSHP